MPIKYLIGDATEPVRASDNEIAIIAHICNNRGGWGAGFVKALSQKWSQPENHYRSLAPDYSLGEIWLVTVSEQTKTIVANMIAQDGFGGVAVSYEALRACLKELEWVIKSCRKTAKRCDYAVHCPRIGAGLGGGDWSVIEKIIEEELCDKGIAVTVYDLA